MCSYNRINGVYASENHHLLTEILRDEWGFEGIVVSDWGANHTTVESIAGGLDLEMPGPARYYGRLLVDAVRNWQIDEALIDQSLRRLLRLVIKSGRIDNPRPSGVLNTPEHQVLARELAEESITLLKNENALLPLKQTQLQSLAVIGPNAADARIGGGGSSFLEPPYRVSPLAALKTRLGQQVEIAYEQGCDNFVDLPVLKSAQLSPAKGEGSGLWAEYFSTSDFSGKPHLERVDSRLEFWWFIAGAGGEAGTRQFSARWTGKLLTPSTGLHTLKLTNTGKCRLYLDGALLIDSTQKPTSDVWPVTSASAQVELIEGRAHDLHVEYTRPDNDEFAMVKLGFAFTPKPETDDRIARAVALAKQSEVAVVFAGMPEGFEAEGADRRQMELPGPQVELIKAVAKANPKTIVVLNCGSPISMPWLADVPAVIEAYYPGQEAGSAVTRVLLGEVNPSGKLSVTFPKRLEDTPAYVNYPGHKEVRYGEGIFVGYRHYDQRDIEPLFPFGFGLSYTTFAYSNVQAPSQVKAGEPVQLSVTVKNTGAVAGKEVVQVYVYDEKSSLPRPPKELKAFAKIALQPGESKTISFSLDRRAFAFYDPYAKAWVVEPGEFKLLVGSSSRDIRATAAVEVKA
jgi:beta-glucosidase